MIGSLQQIGSEYQTRYPSGYLVKVYLIPTNELEYVLVPGEDLMMKEWGIGLKDDALVTEIRCRPRTATLTDSYQGDNSYLTEITIPILTEAPDLMAWAYRHRNRRWLALVQDTLGNCYCVGTHENGGRMSWGRQIGSRHLQSLVLRANSLNPAAWISTLDPDVIFAKHGYNYTYDLYTLTYMSGFKYTTIHILDVRRGDTFEESFALSNDFDLTGCTAKAQVRKFPSDAVTLLELDAEIEGQVIMLSKLPAQMDIAAGNYAYDVQVTAPEGQVFTPFGGKFVVINDVTR